MSKLTVATYNIHSCIGSDKAYDPLRIASVINHIKPDIIGLQEVDTGYRIAEKVHQVSILESETGLHSIEGPTIKNTAGFYGNLVLTKLDNTLVTRKDISQYGFEPRGILCVEFEYQHHTVAFIVTHFGLNANERLAQADMLISFIESLSCDMIIIGGDLNIWCTLERSGRKLRNKLSKAQGLPTFHSRIPLLSLDRIWIVPAVSNMHMYTLNNRYTRFASDHLPLIAEIDL